MAIVFNNDNLEPAPEVITIVLSGEYSSLDIGDALMEEGVLISYRSGYLLERNWIQICMMGVAHRPAYNVFRLLQKEPGKQGLS